MNTSLEPAALLRAFAWARLGAAALLVGIGPWAPPSVVPVASDGLVLAVFALVGASSGVLLLCGAGPRPRVVAWLLCLLDATLSAGIVAATGGARSMLAFLFVPLVTASCVLLSRGGALVVAGVSSALYATLGLARSVVPVMALGEPPDDTTPYDVLAVFVTAGTLAIVAVLVGGLAERFLKTKRALEAERRSLTDLQAFRDVIFRSVATGLVAMDTAHRITALNPAAEELIGVPAAAALGVGWTALVGPGVPLGEIEAAIAGEPSASRCHETELRRADGTVVPVRITGSALCAGNGTRLGLIAACEDLSLLRTMEARVRRADRLAALGRMAANMAHEVRNPLAALRGAVEALTRPGAPSRTPRRLGTIVQREADRLNAMIGHFLDYAQPLPLVIEKIDAGALLEDVLEALTPRLPDGVRVVTRLPACLWLEADRERLRHAMSTLCHQALAAMPAGGELRIDAVSAGGLLRLAVADTGEAIASADLPHVFEPFYATRTEAGGLGLALVHRIVEEHGGHVTVRSDPGRGTEFTIHLPERHG